MRTPERQLKHFSIKARKNQHIADDHPEYGELINLVNYLMDEVEDLKSQVKKLKKDKK